ncbi:hypothetical protein, partial [Providencia sp. PROV193]|uniref:hypothetical protein n=1 Tax=Providencia sp. PROV193 TaxID=2949894 RepID=UPI0023490A46
MLFSANHIPLYRLYYIPTAVNRSVSLYCLYGSEPTDALGANSLTFLSRLCGGERSKRLFLLDSDFLSRLCGGELFVDITVNHFDFLSRLCGGERDAKAHIPRLRF